MKRSSGVLMHISSLFGDYSSGSFGGEAKYFIDFLHDCGFSYWQTLPFCMVDECNSPYKSYSSFAGNPYFVDLLTLHKKGLVTDSELSSCRQQTPYICEFVRLYHTRTKLLMKASKRADNRKEIEDYINKSPYLSKFCEFMALKAANGERPWQEWTNNKINEEILFMWKFIQFEFFAQWNEIHRYAAKRSVKIIGDMPFYVSFDSSDVWANRNLFLLDKDNSPSFVAGVPPDYFSEDGQLWGNPLYNWGEMEKDGYKWWTDRLVHMLSMFDGVRIDHFRAIESYWSVPNGAKTARCGKWEKGPGERFIDIIKEAAKGKLIIAEDLGMITKEVSALLEYSGFPGMRVFQFGFLDERDNPHMPHNYINNCVAYTGTHDNDTLLGHLWEIDGETRRRMLEYCGYLIPEWGRGLDSIIRTVFGSSAGLVIFPIQDLLGFGSDTRLNIPGKADGNWLYRLTREQLDSIDKNKYRRQNHLYKRI